MLKRVLGMLMVLVSSSTYAQNASSISTYNDFLNDLGSLQMNYEQISQKPAVSRFEMTRVLATAQCIDCLLPPEFFVTTYTPTYWTEFIKQPWRNFGDISLTTSRYDNQNYYYCVADGAQQWIVNWYPFSTSPFCPWKFCWWNNANYSELLQAVSNMLAPYVHASYSTDWKAIHKYVMALPADTYQYLLFSLQDRQAINLELQNCDLDSCQVSTTQWFMAYLKYCSLNPSSCWMYEFTNIKTGTWPLAELHVMMKAQLIDLSQIQTLDIKNFVPGNVLLDYAYKLKAIVWCSFDNDYDKDGVVNHLDNAVYVYNPRQADTDSDKIGDVIDEDIDADTILNPVGIVDDLGNIRLEVLKKAMETSNYKFDNCIFTPNVDQRDSDLDWQGDACSKISLLPGTISNQSLITTTKTPLNLWANSNWTWRFSDNSSYGWISSQKSFSSPWYYSLGFQSNWRNDVVTIWVNQSKQDAISMQITSDALVWTWPKTFQLWVKYSGELFRVEYEYNWQKKSVSSPFGLSITLNNAWNYPVTARWYNSQWQLVAISSLNLSVMPNASSTQQISWASSRLEVSPLGWTIWQEFAFQTFLQQIKSSDINRILWDFGDGQTNENNRLTMSKVYNTNWRMIVRQKIYLFDGRMFEDVLTLYINETNSTYGSLRLNADTSQKGLAQDFSFQAVLQDVPLSSVKSVTWTYWDGQTSTLNTPTSLTTTKKYYKAWTYNVGVLVTLQNQKTLFAQTTIQVTGQDICSLQNSQLLRCDNNKNWVPDLCDEDLDNDWIKNPLGLILFETPDCKISSTNINMAQLRSVLQRASIDSSIDNCPFTKNPDQLDTNADWIGDACEEMMWPISDDTDGDWIPNTTDLCPNIPENFNGVEDKDGCPELDFNPTTNINSTVDVVSCNQCPCQYASYSKTITPNDKFRAVIYDSQTRTIYNFSPIYQP